MKDYVEAFEARLRCIFEVKAAEFSKHAEEEPSTAIVTSQLAGLYKDLVEALSH